VIVKWSLAGQRGFGNAGVEDRGAAHFRELQRALTYGGAAQEVRTPKRRFAVARLLRDGLDEVPRFS
jgi:hypothetical protein